MKVKKNYNFLVMQQGRAFCSTDGLNAKGSELLQNLFIFLLYKKAKFTSSLQLPF